MLMSQYYKPKRVRYLYDPKSTTPFRLSRSKIDLFLECPKCFYTDRRLGVGRPPGFPFALNSAVDKLLKKEFDGHRANGTAHPLMKQYGIVAVPFQHENMGLWRDNFKGVSHIHKNTNFDVFGAVDDIWTNSKGELMVVDYKSTSKDSEVNLDADWQIGYKRQMEMYQWLLRQNGFKVSDTGYFVYCNGRTDMEAFDGKLEFHITILSYTGNSEWIDETLKNAKNCLDSSVIPEPNDNCDYCRYRDAVEDVLEEKSSKNSKDSQQKLL